MSAASALTAAIHDAIATAGLAIYDHVPEAALLPYVTVGACTERAWGAKNFVGAEFRLVLDCWSEAPGRGELQDMMESLRAALLDQALDVPGYRIVMITQDSTEILRETDTRIYHGLVRLRLLVHRDDL